MDPVRRSRRQGAGRRARAAPGLRARLPGTANRSDLGQDSNKETSASCRLARQGSAGWTEGGRQVSSGPGGVQAPDRRQARPHFVIFNTDFQTVSKRPPRYLRHARRCLAVSPCAVNLFLPRLRCRWRDRLSCCVRLFVLHMLFQKSPSSEHIQDRKNGLFRLNMKSCNSEI